MSDDSGTIEDRALPTPAGVSAEFANSPLVRESIERYIRESDAPDSRGTGPFRPIKHEVAGLADHVIYEPADLATLGTLKMPVYIFGNGACSDDGSSQRQHLLEIASHGYLVIALGRICSGAGVKLAADDWWKHRDNTSYTLIGDAIDWVIAENVRPGGRYEGRIDTSRIAASGYSCGGR